MCNGELNGVHRGGRTVIPAQTKYVKKTLYAPPTSPSTDSECYRRPQPIPKTLHMCAEVGRKNGIRTKNKGRFNTKRTHTILTCKASISALILSCSLSYEALSGLPVPYSMSVIVEAVEVVVVVSVKAGASYALPDVGFGFLFCESLVEAVLVFVEAAMNEEIEDGGRTRGGQRTVIYGDLIRSRLRRGGI